MTQLDLNRLRETLRDNAREGDAHPDEPRRQLLVTREGKLRFGNDVGPFEKRTLSEVPQQTFAAGVRNLLDSLFGRSPASEERLAADRQTARERLPRETVELTIAGTPTWVCPVRCEFGQRYKLAFWFDGSEYQAKLVEPALEGQFDVHTAHVFSDGRLCLRSPTGGMPTLDQAFAKSVLLVNGLTVLRERGVFPFSPD